ncbi:YjcZ family sporulation protein [Radiobacillus kanasensis]|nr:YjcZ family sporulation protein [Radiobacillus kanasensis]UFT99030.1 YjcZ family sporulation protein [Radiobacillus kanasensis]
MSYAGGVFGNNGFVLLVVIFVLLVIVGNSYPMGGGYGY